MSIVIDPALNETMEERGILEADVVQVVEAALGGEPHLKDGGGQFLAKKKLDKFTVYAQFTLQGDDAEVNNVYSHRVILGEDL